MQLNVFYRHNDPAELPLDHPVCDGGFCGIFRTIGCIGDSLSSGEHESMTTDGKRGYHDFYDYSWGQYLARMCGSQVYNFSKGGMTAQEYCDSFADERGYWDQSLACQAYIIALGENDVNRNPDLGSISDICLADEEQNAKTFAGYYGKIIQKYQKIQPDAKFFLITMPRGGHSDKVGVGDDHAALLYEMASLFSNTYVLDLRKYGCVYDADFRKTFFTGGHMNAMGYLLSAKMIASYIDYIIRHHSEDFNQVGFIGTPYRYFEPDNT